MFLLAILILNPLARGYIEWWLIQSKASFDGEFMYMWLEGEDKETRGYKSDDDDRAFCFASRVG